ncbi:TPA: hypothetical protein DIV55_03060 [Patescibacteria group bacterium]|uniref:Uncharacterized protein n=1 Tax=Candidatus Gottesmanbacteria bacterium GW2011_GWA1_43_11 TaxID=1618436 RepID=A0A0G1CBN4_9BACT|nr:MAG: hypothetical protein UV59_C0053G0006 [Candidatus Gottesmanbacteria bacterium GW2011_GWA1_43_11]HCS78699.1 hypothetical protein [Patescibacteria group bacterium]
MSAGDTNFREKSLNKMQEFFRQGKTIIIVSHWLEYIKQICERVILMEKGKIGKVGKSHLAK